MKFNVKYFREGVLRAEFTVGSVIGAFVGIYKDGAPHRPNGAEIYKKMPAQYREAFDRSMIWLGIDSKGNEVFRADLWDKKCKNSLGEVIIRVDESLETE